VFLVGDAAVSLPFFRGMACLVQCADSLARTHFELLADGSPGSVTAAALRYENEVTRIAAGELGIVRQRATLIRLLREGGRLSALLPFPIQSWLLKARDLDETRDRSTGWLWLNVALALAAVGSAVVGSGWMPILGVPTEVGWPSIPLQIMGGVAYHAALSFERGPHRWVRRVWEFQIASLFGAGLLLTPWASLHRASWAARAEAFWWLVLSAAFVAGLYGFEAFVSRTVTLAALDREG
jgi:hypothetical protein